jgi:hypothetical protein
MTNNLSQVEPSAERVTQENKGRLVDNIFLGIIYLLCAYVFIHFLNIYLKTGIIMGIAAMGICVMVFCGATLWRKIDFAERYHNE